MKTLTVSRPSETAPPTGLLAGEILARVESCYLETRIRGFDFSGTSTTRPLPFVTGTGVGTSTDSWSKLASDLSCFLSEDPIRSRFAPGVLSAEYLTETYVYGADDPVFNRDPLGLKPCGAYPQQPPGGCSGAVCGGQAQWLLCQLHNEHNGLTLLHVVVTAAGIGTGFCVGNVAGAAAGGAAGLLIGELLDAAAMGAAEDWIQQAYADCVRDCAQFKCMMGGHSPPQQCFVPGGVFGGPRLY